jgi:glycosyltransferase involved in cell wall biosynthesis
LNILLINYEYPPIGGGAGNATYNYAREFEKLGHDVVVVTSAFGCIYEYKNENGVHLYRIPALRKYKEKSNPVQMMSFVFSTLLFSYSIIKRHKISHSISFMSIPSGIVGLIIKKMYNLPYLIFLGGGDVPGSQPELDFFHKIVSPLRKSVLKNAKHIIAVSDGLKQLSMQTDRYSTMTINTGVDIKYFEPKLKNNESVCFIYVGRFSAEKNIEYIIKEFALLANETNNTFLYMVGNGPLYEKALELCHKLDLKKRIKFFGWVNKIELRDIYHLSDSIINASKAEGLSNTNLEAMASGLAVVASNVTGNNDLIKHEENGLLFSLNEDNGLYKALKRLVEDKNLLNYLKSKSREEACEYYAWEMSARKYIELLRNWA